MTGAPKYPLEQLIAVKKTRFDTAVKVLEEKKNLLEKAYEKLYDATQEETRVLEHKTEKLAQLRQELDIETTTEKVQRAKVYLKIVNDDLAQKQKKTKECQKQVDAAQKQVDAATETLFQRKKDLEKLEIHKKEWEIESGVVLRAQEGSLQDEQGSSVYFLRRKEEDRKMKERKRIK